MYAIIRDTKSTSSPRTFHDHSSSPCFCSFTPMDPDIAPDSSDGCSDHGPVLARGSPAVRKRKPRRLRPEGAKGVAIMTSDTRGLCHADMIRFAATRPRGAASAAGVLCLVLTRWRVAPTDAGRNEALGLHGLECRRLQAGTLSGFVEYLCLATAASAECRIALGSRVTTHSNDINANNSKNEKYWAEPQPSKKKNGPVKINTHKLESYQDSRGDSLPERYFHSQSLPVFTSASCL